MSILRRVLAGALPLVLSGCADFWNSPSILTSAPPPPPARGGSHESRGGFSVFVNAPGQPTVARAVADIGAYAQGRGFTRAAAGAGADRYVAGKVVLDVFFRDKDSQVVALLHCVGLSRRFAEDFSRGFNRDYAARYGEENPIIPNDFEEYQRPPY